MREVVRRSHIVPGWDLLFIARPAALDATFSELRDGLIKVINQAHLNADHNETVQRANKT